MSLLSRRAETLAEAIINLDHEPLKKYEIDDYYVDRKSRYIRRIANELKSNYPQKYSFTSQGGVGKSTELTKLGEMLPSDFEVFQCSVERNVSDKNITYVDILKSIGNTLLKNIKNDIKYDKKLEEAFDSFARVTSIDRAKSKSEGGGADVSAGVAKAGVRRTNTNSTVEHELIESKISELIEILNYFCNLFHKRGKKIVLVFEYPDDEDSVEDAETIFDKYGWHVCSPDMAIIYTLPFSLKFSKKYNNIINKNFNGRNCELYNFNLNYKYKPNTEGRLQLEEILFNRVNKALFGEGVVKELIDNSGGVPRNLLSLARMAALEAMGAGVEIITRNHVAVALSDAEKIYVNIKTEQMNLLNEVRVHKSINQTPEYQELVCTEYILEYFNYDDETWYDVNPLANNVINKKAKQRKY